MGAGENGVKPSLLSKISQLWPHVPVALDVAGLALLAVAAGLVAVAAGVAVAGVGCLVLSWRVAK